tara:strand:+ start:439 stop:891 length:453 start_codon:yes stop_codon:yes gene_type:complete
MGKIIHGMAKTPTYNSWHKMMQRCYEPSSNRFYAYGAKGVSVHPSWHDFMSFVSDMGIRPEGTTLGRFEDKGNYEPGNVAWQTPEEQARKGERCPTAKLTQEQAECIRSLHQCGQNHPRKKWLVNGRNISRDLGISQAQVSSILHYKSYV